MTAANGAFIPTPLLVLATVLEEDADDEVRVELPDVAALWLAIASHQVMP